MGQFRQSMVFHETQVHEIERIILESAGPISPSIALANTYGFDVLGNEASGYTFRDSSDSGNNLTALTGIGNPNANAGYMSTEAGVGKLITLPAEKFSFDLASDSLFYSMTVKFQRPATNTNLAGNIAGASDGYGFYFSARSSGVLAPVFNASGGNWTLLTGYPIETLGSALDTVAADHTVSIAYDAPSRSVYYWLDNVLMGSFNNVIRPGLASKSTYPFGWGAIYGAASATAVACQFKNVKCRVWARSGLPLNIGAVVKSAVAYPGDLRYLADVYSPANPAALSAIAWVGQSNEYGTSDWPDSSSAIGAPTKDALTSAGLTSVTAATAGSMHPQIAALGGRRGTWRSTFNTGNGGTSITQFWNGQYVSWSASTNYSKGAYLPVAGKLFKLTSSSNVSSPNIAQSGSSQPSWPSSGTVVDGEATWTYLRAATALDAPGNVISYTDPLFDPNGAVANIKSNFALLPARYNGRKFVCISIGQGDKSVSATQAQYTAAIQNITNYLLSLQYKVLIGFTCSGLTSGLDTWLSTIGKPGYLAALASFADNDNVFPGADLYSSLGVLTVNANGIGLLSDQVHMNRFTMPLAASFWDTALANAGA